MARRSTQTPKATEDAAKAADQVADQNTQGADDAEQSAEAHAAAPAQQAQGHPGGGDGAPEVPAGDQDNAETVTAAIIAGASDVKESAESKEPAEATESAEQKEPAERKEPTEPEQPDEPLAEPDKVLRVTGPKKGRWRIGRRFDRSPVDIPFHELSEDDVQALDADKTLTIELVQAS
ncbi:MAG: hypothetical protein AB7S99_10285 [Pseudodonghicola sp.]